MPARTPEEVHKLFIEYFSAADVDGVLSLYEPQATMMPQPGQTVSGTEAIGEALKGFLALNGKFNMTDTKVIESGDLAIVYSAWTLAGTDPEGNEVNLSGKTSDVVRRQSDGNWLIVIDNPYGGDGVAG